MPNGKENLTVIIPMAGRGFRVKDFCSKPKPLIEVAGKKLINWSVETLEIEAKYIFICLKNFSNKLNLEIEQDLRSLVNHCHIIWLEELTHGPAQTCLFAKELVDKNAPLIITNCDQALEWDSNKFLEKMKNPFWDGLVVTYPCSTPKNSYVKTNSENLATEFAEKKVISKNSLNGIHYWKRASDFFESCEEMISQNERVNGEFYIAPTYNYLIARNKKIGIFEIEKRQHWALGTIEDLKSFEEHKNATDKR